MLVKPINSFSGNAYVRVEYHYYYEKIMINLKTHFNKFLTHIKFQIWGHKAVTEKNKDLWDQYVQEQFHDKLVADSLVFLKRLSNTKRDPNETSLFIGHIKLDWYSNISKTEEKDKSMSDNS